MSTLPRRAVGAGRLALLRLAGALRVAALPGRAAREAVVFFLELRDRVLAVFFADFLLAFDLEADFFLVTLRFASFRFFADLPALVVFFPDFFLADFFFTAFFFGAFFLLAFFLLAFFEAFFLLTFFLLTFFLPTFFRLDFLEDLAIGRLRERLVADFFETFFLAAAFFFGMRKVSGWLQKTGRRLYIDAPAREA